MMGERLSTVIIEPRRLVREALVSLLLNHSYQVVCSVASTGDIDSSVAEDAPKLVILGARSAEDAATDASKIRRLWLETKIILLFEHASAADFDKLLTSEIDGCIPLFVSRNSLIGTLQLIVVEDLRILVVGVSNHPLTPRAMRCKEKPNGFEASANKLHSGTVDYAAALTSAIGPPHARPPIGDIGASKDARNGGTHGVSSPLSVRSLSEREGQILKGLVKGHSNKMIARTCAVAEATVKVHMKSILRKIRVANRTQAAIWALEHGYGAKNFKHQQRETRPHWKARGRKVDVLLPTPS
jgi:two-component system nitrate/nitrite response regulator NarL